MRRGAVGNQLSFLSFLFLLSIVGVGIVAGTLLFFGGGTDYRVDESVGVGYLLEQCIRNEAFIDSLASCGIDELAIGRMGSLVSVCAGDCFKQTSRQLLRVGDSTETCRIAGGKNSAYPGCAERYFIHEGTTYHIVVGTFVGGKSR